MNKPQMRQVAPNVLPGVMPDSMKPLICKCGGVLFSQIFAIKIASPLQTTIGKPMNVQFPMGYYCLECKQINQFMEPEDANPKVPESKASSGDLGVNVSEKVKSGEALS